MKFDSTLDELEYWMQLLRLELHRGAERRYLTAIGRLCEVFAQKVSRDKYAPAAHLHRRMKLSMTWLDLKRELDGNAPAPAQPGAPAQLRVIQGGRSQTGTTRR